MPETVSSHPYVPTFLENLSKPSSGFKVAYFCALRFGKEWYVFPCTRENAGYIIFRESANETVRRYLAGQDRLLKVFLYFIFFLSPFDVFVGSDVDAALVPHQCAVYNAQQGTEDAKQVGGPNPEVFYSKHGYSFRIHTPLENCTSFAQNAPFLCVHVI